jgi:hypothetical protein
VSEPPNMAPFIPEVEMDTSRLIKRASAFCFCAVPALMAVVAILDEPSREEAVLWVGVEALLCVAAGLNLIAAFAHPQVRALWMASLLGNCATLLFLILFSLHRGEAIWGVAFIALAVGPTLWVSARNWRRVCSVG